MGSSFHAPRARSGLGDPRTCFDEREWAQLIRQIAPQYQFFLSCGAAVILSFSVCRFGTLAG
jgi:hypothetical protein